MWCLSLFAVTPEGMDAGEAALLKEMAEVKRRMEERQKRDRKRRRETKKKAKIRAAQARMVGGGDRDMELFDLKEIKSRKNVQAVTEAPMPEVRGRALRGSRVALRECATKGLFFVSSERGGGGV